MLDPFPERTTATAAGAASGAGGLMQLRVENASVSRPANWLNCWI